MLHISINLEMLVNSIGLLIENEKNVAFEGKIQKIIS